MDKKEYIRHYIFLIFKLVGVQWMKEYNFLIYSFDSLKLVST